ncbi:type III secretion system inner membrane ring lipoprotein SctJ [Vulcaniibacterium thermophilum]|uniref:Lipoprotein n=1 Tax=Vulcaniibacterium thermophilum TaxID=1169913 RepID=A0A918YWV0_9GAMM|nr:type III secretion inner membrane ring lipoprotein SctJ [Vulcaniibacterium thermophilum]GHE26445.1 EscJ/YscJ/HrcJ family type III secretion inner membrane ring protein [Vulcaniibacterium thermophilum]
MNAGRILTAALLALMLAACGRTALYSQLDEQQANELMAALLDAGIPAEKAPSASKTGWEVSVNRGDIPYAMQVLNARGLPRAQHRSLGDVFKKEGFASSALEEKARYLFGLSQELERTLSRIDGVVEARVHIALPDKDPLGGQNADSSASVILFERPGANLRARETDLKVFIKDSIEGLDDVNKVTIKFFEVQSAPPPKRQGAAAAVAAISPVAVGISAGLVMLAGAAVALRRRWWPQRKAPAPVSRL